MEEKRRINVRAIIYKNGQLLAVKHKSNTGEASPYYAIPGGGLDPLESLEDGLRREIMEETGINATVGRLLFIQQFKSERSGFDEELEFFFEVTNSDDFDTVDLATTSHGHHELTVCEFVTPSEVNILPKFLQTLNITSYISNDKPTHIVNNFNE